MRTSLLTLAALALASAANAQLLSYGFEEGENWPGGIVTENWANYSNSTVDFKSTDAFGGSLALGVKTDVTCNTWERVVAFKQIPVEPMKSYRVSFMAKGDAPINLGILQGDFNRDIALQIPGGGTQVYNEAITKSWSKVTRMFWVPSFADMEAAYKGNHSDELLTEYFLRLAFTGVGEFTVDDVMIEEASIAGITYNADVVAVNFGYATNGKELAAEAGGTAVLSPECVSVLVNGEAAAVETVEIKGDGNFYIFLTEDYYLGEDDKVSVSFTNGIGLKYGAGAAPNCYEEPNCDVLAFADEAGAYDDELIVSSLAWEEAELVTSDPEDGSFELDPSVNTFSFTFNKPVLTSFDGDPAVANLSGNGIEEALVIVEAEEASKTITFKRAEGSAPFAKGQYSIVVSNVYNEKGVATGDLTPISFEVGKVVVAETTYNLVAECTFSDAPANGIPEGWEVMSDGALRTSAESFGSGGRVFDCAAPQKKGIYTRANGGEGSVTSPLVDIPAGDVEFRTLICGWSGNSNVTLQLLDENGEVAFENTFNTEIAAENIRNNGDFKFGVATFRFKHNGGQLKMYIKLNTEGFNGMFVGGFEVYTYTETAGEKNEIETLVEGRFSDVAGNYIPAYGSGWRIHRGNAIRTPGANGGWGGNCPTGGGGPRMFDLSFKNIAGKGVYLDGGDHNWLTYGEFLTYEVEEDGVMVEKDEKVCTLPSSKLQFTYYSALWKADGVELTMQILRQEDGIEGTPVFERKEVINTKSPQGIQSDGSVEAMKTQFFWTCPEAGNYIIKFFTNGEGFVGNISVETTASMAVQYKNLLKAALVDAKAELETAMADENYRGTTRDALDKAITDYTNPDFHTPREYTAAIAHLEQLVKAMSTRRGNINNFAAGVEALANGLNAAIGTKYENLAEFDLVKSYYEKYAQVDPVSLDDEELADAVAVMQSKGNLLKNMVNDCIGFLTAQASQLAGMIVALDAEQDSAGYVLAAYNALTDDQQLVTMLKKLYNGKLYAKLACEDPFHYEEYDPALEITAEVTDSIDVSAMIQNRGFYTDAQKQQTGALANEQSFPGWNITIAQNSILADWGWGGPYNCTAERPISDAAVCTAWGTSDVDVNQLIADLPVGVYTAIIKVGDGTSTNEENLSRAYVKTAAMEEALEQVVINDGGSRNAQPYTFSGIAADVEGTAASLTIGAKLMSRGDFSKCDDAALFLTDKVAGFDYAAASAELLKEVAEGIQLQERDDQPAQTVIYDLNGRQMSAAQGVCIRIDRYADGYTVVRKVVVR